MIKIENFEAFNFIGAMRGMRNPLESWAKSDTRQFIYQNAFHPMALNFDEDKYHVCQTFGADALCVEIGPNDLACAQKLILAGSDHRKFMRQIFVSVDITAPLYWWKEMSTYKVSTVANSTSTMHKIMSKPFDISMFAADQLRGFKQIIIQKPNEIDEDTEEWKDWPTNSLYQVSNQGRVRRKEYTTTHNRTWKERILTNTETSDHYLKVGVKIDGQQKDRRVHQLVAQTWLENPSNYSEVNHKNGNKLDNRAENLEWCSSSSNQQHAIDHSLQPKGIVTYKGKLTKDQRDEVISLYNAGHYTRRELGKLFDVSHTTICSIINNKYNYGEGFINEYQELLNTIDKLNELRDEWLLTKDQEVWYSIIQLLPSSWLQTRTWTGNYETLRNIFFARRNHKLIEWRTFCLALDQLPYSKELISFE